MNILCTFEAIKTLCFSGDDVRIADENGNSIDVDAALGEAFCGGGRWIINNSDKLIDPRERRQGRVFAGSAYSIDETGRRTGRAMHATMRRVTVADIFSPALISAFQAAESHRR